MQSELASFDEVEHRARASWRPPEELNLSDWAERYYILSPETAAEPGRWRTLPYQVEIMNSITDPEVEQVTLMKSARIGYTLMLTCTIGYFMEHDPTTIMVVQPTVDDAKGFSKESIAPMLRDVPVLAAIRMGESSGGPRDRGDTLRHKTFPGGILAMVGANSGAGLRRVSRRIVLFDEVDAYPPSAGNEGDPIRLGKKRAQEFHDRTYVIGSTPLTAGTSRVEEEFTKGDQRRYHVPCPHCGHRDFMTFSARKDGRGHVMKWPKGKPEAAYFECSGAGCTIEHRDKRRIVAKGEWIPDNPDAPPGHRSYHVWAAISYSPNATWGGIAQEFLDAKAAGAEALKTFVNTVLGETWEERGEAPSWEILYNRRKTYQIGSVPIENPLFLTGGADVQADRVLYEVVAWEANKRSHSVEAGVIMGSISDKAVKRKLDALCERDFPTSSGSRVFRMSRFAIDSGWNTQEVYNWVRTKPVSLVMAVKGVQTAKAIVGLPTPVDVNEGGRLIKRGVNLWSVGVDHAKAQIYGWLKLERPTDGSELPDGWCDFPEYDEEFFLQLTSEHLVKVVKTRGRVVFEWRVLKGRENHYLDTRVYALAAAIAEGLNTARPPAPHTPKEPPKPPPRDDFRTVSHDVAKPPQRNPWGRRRKLRR